MGERHGVTTTTTKPSHRTHQIFLLMKCNNHLCNGRIRCGFAFGTANNKRADLVPEPIVFAFLGIKCQRFTQPNNSFRCACCGVLFALCFFFVGLDQLPKTRTRRPNGPLFGRNFEGMCSSFKCRVNYVSHMGMTLKIKIIDKKNRPTPEWERQKRVVQTSRVKDFGVENSRHTSNQTGIVHEQIKCAISVEPIRL